MQYILTQEEKDNLIPKKEKQDRDKALELARKRIMQLSGRKCIHESGGHNLKCDGCPCLETSDECKEYEFKIGNSVDLYQLHRLICTLNKSFSK